jgi:ketosteroid isomerase-like protein
MNNRNIRAEAARVMPSEGTSVECEIEQMYHSYFDAFKAKDAAAALAVMTKDFTWKLPDGTSLDRSETKAAIEEQMATILQVDEMSAQIHSVALEGDSARVELTEKLIADAKAQDGSQGLRSGGTM